VGFDFNTYLGTSAGESTTTGSSNVSVGYGAGFSTTDGSGNIFIGNYAGYYETGSNKLYISNSEVDFPLIYGEFDTGLLMINGDVYAEGDYFSPLGDIWATTVKSGTDPAKDAISSIRQLNSGYYELESKAGGSTRRLGLVAEDLEKVFPGLVRKNIKGERSVNYTGLVPVLIEAVKEQQAQIEAQQAQIDALLQIVNSK
jgi:hypothetical protein